MDCIYITLALIVVAEAKLGCQSEAAQSSVNLSWGKRAAAVG